MVQLASPLLYGADIVEWQERIDAARMRSARTERLRQVMRKHQLAACLLTVEEDQRYAVGARSMGNGILPQPDYVLFFAEGEPVVYQHAGAYHHLTDQTPWISDMRIGRSWLGGIPGRAASEAEARLFAGEITDEIRTRGLASEPLGVNGLDRFGAEALGESGIKLTDCSQVMLEARSVKTVDEINCLKMAAAIADVSWYRSLQEMRPGIRDTELAAVATRAAMEAGADGILAINFFSGPYTFERGLARTGRIIQYGDLVYCDHVGVSFLGYKTCYYRTFVVGREPLARERDWYKRLVDRLDGVIDAIKPGATTADAAVAFEPASTWGYPNEVHLLTLEIGHGIGLKLYEMPCINRQWSLEHPQTFEVGMTMAIEGREGEPGKGGVRLEDMIVVTENGAELLDRMPRDEILVASRIT